METLPNKNIRSTCLELTIAMPGIISSPVSFPYSSGESVGVAVKGVDLNQEPTKEHMEEEEEDNHESPNKGPTPRKKLRLTKEQSHQLEESFLQNPSLNHKLKETLAVALKLKERQVEVWFQNRRARSKTKQTEMECEYLRKRFETLIEQNRWLNKEVEELRVMKVAAPPHNRQLRPASTLTACPKCELVAATGHLDKGPATTTLAAEPPMFLKLRKSTATCFD